MDESPKFERPFEICLASELWQSSVEIRSITSEGGARKNERTQAKHNGCPCICI